MPCNASSLGCCNVRGDYVEAAEGTALPEQFYAFLVWQANGLIGKADAFGNCQQAGSGKEIVRDVEHADNSGVIRGRLNTCLRQQLLTASYGVNSVHAHRKRVLVVRRQCALRG